MAPWAWAGRWRPRTCRQTAAGGGAAATHAPTRTSLRSQTSCRQTCSTTMTWTCCWTTPSGPRCGQSSAAGQPRPAGRACARAGKGPDSAAPGEGGCWSWTWGMIRGRRGVHGPDQLTRHADQPQRAHPSTPPPALAQVLMHLPDDCGPKGEVLKLVLRLWVSFEPSPSFGEV